MQELIGEIKKFSEDELYELETYDLQYQALKKLQANLKNNEIFVKLVIFNALLAYQLTTTWEKYRQNFANFHENTEKNQIKEKMEEFIKNYNKRLLNMRLKRLEKISPFIEEIDINIFEKRKENQELFLSDLIKTTKQDKQAKTLVFAVKMFVRSMRICGYKTKVSKKIFIPIDNRIWKISKNKDFWVEIQEKTNISLLLLDSLFYISMSNNIWNIANISLKKKVELFWIFIKNKYLNWI